MATHIGNEGKVKIGSNVVAEVRSFQITESVAIADDSAIGDDWGTHLVGGKSWRGSLECRWDETDTTGQGALTIGASVTLNLYPEGDGSGDTYFSGTATVTQITRQSSRDNVITAAFEFQGNGALSSSTV